MTHQGLFGQQENYELNYRYPWPIERPWYWNVTPGYQPAQICGAPPPWGSFEINQIQNFNPLWSPAYNNRTHGLPPPWGDGVSLSGGFGGFQGSQSIKWGQLATGNPGVFLNNLNNVEDSGQVGANVDAGKVPSCQVPSKQVGGIFEAPSPPPLDYRESINSDDDQGLIFRRNIFLNSLF